MMTLIAGLAGALLVAGVLGVLAGACRRPVVVGTPPRRGRGRLARWWVSLGRGTQVGAVVALAAGVLVGITSGFYLAVFVAPLAVVGLPYLLMRSTQAADIGRLEAMAEWSRNLSGVLTAGVNLEQALVVSLRSTPAPIQVEVSRLVGRLDARWRIEDALRAFAHDLADATGDLMVMELMLGARSRGAGLATVLAGVAESTAADVAARRAIEADRAKPRATARWVTILSSGAMVFFAFSGRFLDPYRTPSGQMLLGVLLAGYGFTLVQMRRMSTGRPFPRLLTDAGEG